MTKTITKKFVQRYIAQDCEGREFRWKDTEKTYEELKAKYLEKRDTYVDAIREVEKTFNTETFEITEKTIRKLEWTYDWKTHEGTFKETETED